MLFEIEAKIEDSPLTIDNRFFVAPHPFSIGGFLYTLDTIPSLLYNKFMFRWLNYVHIYQAISIHKRINRFLFFVKGSLSLSTFA